MNTRLLTLTALMLLTACGSRPSPDLYVLRAAPDRKHCSAARLIIDRPDARSELSGKRIAVMADDHHLTYYTGVAWASSFPEQLRNFMAESLGATTQDMPNATHLLLTVQAAEVTAPDAPGVHLKLSVIIARGQSRSAPFAIDETVPTAAHSMEAILDAFNQAAANAAKKLAPKLGARCRAA